MHITHLLCTIHHVRPLHHIRPPRHTLIIPFLYGKIGIPNVSHCYRLTKPITDIIITKLHPAWRAFCTLTSQYTTHTIQTLSRVTHVIVGPRANNTSKAGTTFANWPQDEFQSMHACCLTLPNTNTTIHHLYGVLVGAFCLPFAKGQTWPCTNCTGSMSWPLAICLQYACNMLSKLHV